MSRHLAAIARKSVSGMAATSLVTLVRFAASFGSQLVLVRLLAPQVFGEYAFLLVVHGAIGMARSLRGAEYVVRLSESELEWRYAAVWTIEVSIGICAGLATFLVAEPLMTSLGEPELAPFLKILAAHFVLGSCALPGALLSRRLAFWRAQLPSLVGAVLRPALKIAFAHGGLGLASLVLGDLVGFALEIVLLWSVGRAPIRFAIDREVGRDLARFGLPLVLAQILTYYYWKVDDFIVARLLGMEALGYYYLAFRIPEYLFQFKIALSPVAYSALARLGSIDERRAYFEGLTRVTFVILAPVVIVSFLFGREWLVLLFGGEWEPAAVPFQILMVAMALRMSFGYSADLVQLAGRTRILVWTALANGAVLTAACVPMTHYWGIAGTGLSVAAMVLAGLPVSIWIAKLEVGARFGPVLARSAAALVVVLALGFAARRLADPRSALTLVGFSALLTFVYYALALWWQPDLARSGAALFRRATPAPR